MQLELYAQVLLWGFFLALILGTIQMGVGGILGMGRTIGQGITGVATLALGSFVTIIAIIVGSAGSMKYQYYRIMHEP